jgi:hypothetical protein
MTRVQVIIVTAVVTLLFTLVLRQVYFNSQFECASKRVWQCKNTYCSMWLPVNIGDVQVMNCFAWETKVEQCEECIEWRRKE